MAAGAASPKWLRWWARSRLASGTIRSSLFAATDESRIPDAVAVQIAEIFAADIDFHRELRKGDSFSAVYETDHGRRRAGHLGTWPGACLSAEFVNDGKAHHARLVQPTPPAVAPISASTARSKRRAFLASPMEFSRITSGFAMRFHPILQTLRVHRGVDYGAPHGTPVRSVGDGVVDFAGWQNGYGNVVKIQHGKERSTLYAHLSRIDVRKGQAIEQGQRLGAVGATGWATGPHLHFEFQVNGLHLNPLSLAKASDTVTVDNASRTRFAELARSAKLQLDLAETLGGSRSQLE